MSDPIGAFLFRPRGADAWQALPYAPGAVAAAPRRARSVKIAPSGGRPLRVEVRPLADLGELREAWSGLAERTLEQNIFAEPVFALNTAQHLAEARKALAVLVFEESAGPSALVGLFPVFWSRTPFVPNAVRAWRSSYASLGVPLVDRLCAEPVIEAYLAFLGSRGARCAAALFPMVPASGAFARALSRVAARSGRSLESLERNSRAVLNGAGAPPVLAPKKLKELKRQLRRLGDLGEVRFERHREPCAVRAALETFLVLEASGWKSGRGTAMVQDARVATFVRTTTRELAREGRCRIDVLKVGDRPIAAGITIESGDRAFFWKVAYDEAYARYSPGVQLTLELTRRQLDRKSITLTDSCAIPNHPMIDHLWRDRMEIVDLMVGTRREPSRAARAVAHREHARARLRAIAKSAYYRLRGGKVS